MDKIERHKSINILQVVNVIDQILFNMTVYKTDKRDVIKTSQILKFDCEVSKLILKLISNKPINSQEIKFIKHVPKLIKDSHVTKAEMKKAKRLGLLGSIPTLNKYEYKCVSTMLDKLSNQ